MAAAVMSVPCHVATLLSRDEYSVIVCVLPDPLALLRPVVLPAQRHCLGAWGGAAVCSAAGKAAWATCLLHKC